MSRSAVNDGGDQDDERGFAVRTGLYSSPPREVERGDQGTLGHTTMRRRQGRRRRSPAAAVVDPFAGRDRFPPLEEFFLVAGSEGNHRSDSSSFSLDLSIGAQAALHEHLRHVARFGIDNSLVGSESPSDLDLNAGAIGAERYSSRDPLDEEWERLLATSSNDGGPSSSSQGSSFSLRHSRSVHDEHGCGDAFDVLTERSTDYFNSSRVKLLLTPEKNRHRRGEVTTRRGGFGVESSSNSSILSSSLEEDRAASDVASADRDEDGDGGSQHASVSDKNQLFPDANAMEAIDDVSRISALDVSHISADGSDAGQQSFHLFAPTSTPFCSFTPPRSTVGSASAHRSTIDDGLARVGQYSSPQSSYTRMRSPRPSLSHLCEAGSPSCLPPSSKSRSGNNTADRTRNSLNTHSTEDNAGFSKADDEVSGLPHLRLSPISTQSAVNHREECQRNGLTGNVAPLDHLVDNRRSHGPALPSSDVSSANAPSCSGFRIDPRPSATFTILHHDHVEVVYDGNNGSDVSSLHNHSSSVDRTSSSSATSAAVTASAPGKVFAEGGERALKSASEQENAPNLTLLDRQLAFDDRRRYRTVVPSRVFLTTFLDDDLIPEPYDSFSNPLPRIRERYEWISARHDAASHRSAPL